jgi:hypothetical protein
LFDIYLLFQNVINFVYKSLLKHFFYICEQGQVDEYDVVLKVRQIISELTVNPAIFDEVMIPLTDLFAVTVCEESTLAAVVEEIFVQVKLAMGNNYYSVFA